jgi:ATP-dependent DNA helicase RecQ
MSNDNHEYLPTETPSVLTRRVAPDMKALPSPRRFFQAAEARMVDLSYAGRLHPGHSSLSAVNAARVGDAVLLVKDGDRWLLHNEKGQVLSRMSKSFAPPPNTRFERGEIAAILKWRKEDSGETFHHTLRRDAWEVVLPELVFVSVN